MKYFENNQRVQHTIDLTGLDLIWLLLNQKPEAKRLADKVIQSLGETQVKDIKVRVRVPSGADWSGMDLDLDSDSKVSIMWETNQSNNPITVLTPPIKKGD